MQTTTDRDELLAATRRYNAMTAVDHARPRIPAAAWYRIAARMRVAARRHGVGGQTLGAVEARVRDAVARGVVAP